MVIRWSDLTTYLIKKSYPNEKTRTTKHPFWFPRPENPGKTEDHTPIQTRVHKKYTNWKKKKKINTNDVTGSQIEVLERVDWTKTLVAEVEKQAFKDILVEYHDVFKHRMYTGTRTEFEVKLTPKDDKVVYRKNLQMLIHLGEGLFVEFAPLHKRGIITVLPFPKFAYFSQRTQRKITSTVVLKKI